MVCLQGLPRALHQCTFVAVEQWMALPYAAQESVDGSHGSLLCRDHRYSLNGAC